MPIFPHPRHFLSSVARLSTRSRALFLRADSPMNLKRGAPTMQVTVTISDAIVREAGARGLPVVEFVESLIDKGLSAARGRPVLDSAMERIRALALCRWSSQAIRNANIRASARWPGGRCSSHADRLIGLQSQCLHPFASRLQDTSSEKKRKRRTKKTQWILKHVTPSRMTSLPRRLLTARVGSVVTVPAFCAG